MNLQQSINMKNAGNSTTSSVSQNVAKVIQKQTPNAKVTAPGVGSNAKTNATF